MSPKDSCIKELSLKMVPWEVAGALSCEGKRKVGPWVTRDVLLKRVVGLQPLPPVSLALSWTEWLCSDTGSHCDGLLIMDPKR